MKRCGNAGCVVTGGAGFIGSRLLKSLCEASYCVRCIDVRRNLGMPELQIGDVRDAEHIRNVLAGAHSVIHLAAVSSVDETERNPGEAYSVNVSGTHTVLTQAVRCGVRRFVFASSCAAASPRSHYGLHKLQAEQLCQAYAALIDTLCLRYSNVYGAFRAGSVITEFTTRMLQGRRPLVYGTGHQERDFVHVADVVSATLKAVRLSRRNRGDVLDIASGERISVLGLVSMLNDILGTQLEPIFLPERASDVRVPPLQNMSKSEDILGWKPSIPLYEGIREYVLSQTASG